MRSLRYAVAGVLLLGLVMTPVRAAPTVNVVLVKSADLEMATEDLLQNKPFEVETRLAVPAREFQLTDATGLTEPLDDQFLFGLGEEPTCLRWDLGSLPPEGRELKSVFLYLRDADPARNGAYFKLAAHDVASGKWRDLMEWVDVKYSQPLPDTCKVIIVTFPEGEVTGFDALRMYDGRGPLTHQASTRWIEVDAFSTPENR